MWANLHSSRGWGLVETMIAVALFALLIVLGLPIMSGSLRNLRVRAAAESVQNGLQQARAAAVQRNSNVEFIVAAGSPWTWTVQLPAVNGGDVIATWSSVEGAGDVVLSANPPAGAKMTFNGRGGVTPNADGSACLYEIGFSATGVTHPLRLNVSISGAIRMCDVSVTNSADNRFCTVPTHC